MINKIILSSTMIALFILLGCKPSNTAPSSTLTGGVVSSSSTSTVSPPHVGTVSPQIDDDFFQEAVSKLAGNNPSIYSNSLAQYIAENFIVPSMPIKSGPGIFISDIRKTLPNSVMSKITDDNFRYRNFWYILVSKNNLNEDLNTIKNHLPFNIWIDYIVAWEKLNSAGIKDLKYEEPEQAYHPGGYISFSVNNLDPVIIDFQANSKQPVVFLTFEHNEYRGIIKSEIFIEDENWNRDNSFTIETSFVNSPLVSGSEVHLLILEVITIRNGEKYEMYLYPLNIDNIQYPTYTVK